MKWFYLTIMPLLSAFKVTLQGYFSKGKLNSNADMLKFTGFMSLYSAISLILLTVRVFPSFETVIYSLILALSTIVFQLFYAKAMKSGPVSITCTMINFAVVISIVFSIIVYKEPITIYKIIGFILFGFALILTPQKQVSRSKTSFMWLIFCFLTIIASGTTNIIQIVFSRSEFSNEKAALTALSYVFASALCFIIIPFIKGNQPLYKTDKKLGIALPFIGLALGLYNLFSVSAMEIIPVSEFTPTLSSLNILCTILTSCIILKERLSIKQIIGIICTICAVVLVNL